jgi:hypothetical protein
MEVAFHTVGVNGLFTINRAWSINSEDIKTEDRAALTIAT